VGRYSVAMLAEVRKPAPAVVELFSLTIAGTSRYYSQLGAMVSGVGLYEPKVLSWGALARGVSWRYNSLELWTYDVILDDADQAFSKLVEGPNRNAIRGSVATRVLASPNVAPASWFTKSIGQVDTIRQPGRLMWQITVSSKDLPLKRESIPKHSITRSDWPNASLDVLDQPSPIAYGNLSSASGGNNGAVLCFLVDTVKYRYLVCAGWAKAVDKVYADAIGVAAAGYTVTHPIVNGRVYTCIVFPTDQGTKTITADIQGYETVGDGSGILIVDPAAIGIHVLTNWIFGDYRSGAWLSPSTAPVDTTSWGTTFFSSRNYSGSLYVGTKRKGLDVLNDVLASAEAKAYWTAAGTIALAIDDWTTWAYPDQVLLEDEMNGWDLNFPTVNIIDSIDARYGLRPADGSYTQALAVKDLGILEQAPDTLELPCSAAFIV